MSAMMLATLTLLSVLCCTVAFPATDFVVVGAGTAGCTIAAKLCEQLPKATITIIERGERRTPTDRLQSESAANLLNAWLNPNLTDALRSRPARGANNRVFTLFNGANYGGASAVNGGQILLPPSGTFKQWGIRGLTDSRAENLFWNVLRPAQPGTGVPPPELRAPFSARWLRAAAAAGLPFAPTPFKPPRTSSISFDTRLTFDQQGKRLDACRTFLRPVRGGTCKDRVTVLRGWRAERVVFENGKARSVVITRARDGLKKRASARREVLLAAGALESAALLLRSGVGPEKDIKSRVFRFVKDLPVGQRLQTRPYIPVSSRYSRPLADVNDPDQVNDPAAIAAFRAGRGGVLGKSVAGPQMRIEGFGYGFALVGQFPDLAGKPILSTYCVVDVTARSFGRVRLPRGDGATTAAEPPVIDLRVLERAKDMEQATGCVARLRDIHKELNELIDGTELFPAGLDADALATEAGLVKKVKADTQIVPHYVGTCAVGEVVDNELRVLGLDGVRVVDSGAIPRLPKTAGPMTSVYIVALHAAELVASAHPDLA